MRKGLSVVAVLAVLGLVVWGLLIQFQTEEIDTPPDSRSLVSFEVVDRGIPASRAEAAAALWSACVVDLAPAPVRSLERVGEDRFRGILSPALDRFETRELRGCLNDLILPHLRGTAVVVRHRGTEEVPETDDG